MSALSVDQPLERTTRTAAQARNGPALALARPGVGLLGCGVVGAAVARRLLLAHPGLLRAVAVRDPHKSRDVDWGAWNGDPFAVVDDPSVSVVVECIGGVRLARELVLRAIAHGKDVVTANKELIAQDGPWLRAFAARTGATLHYEASVGGAIPILRALETSLADEPILEVGGVVNGTTNFMLSQMESGASYADALAEAQRRGFAEADPRNDVEGFDAAHKLAILATLAFRGAVAPATLVRDGITAIVPDDIALAAERGWRLKLVALARRVGEGIEAGVTPAYIAREHAFARPSGAENVVRVVGANSGVLEFFGLGAGGAASASSVVGDILSAIDLRARGIAPHRGVASEAQAVAALRLPVVVRNAGGAHVTEPLPLDELAALTAQPGVLAAIPLLV
jgi:homoserine dehydrogenase